MAQTVKMCDMNKFIAVKVFEMLNGNKIRVAETRNRCDIVIVTDVEPKLLVYPEGWYYAKGAFRNKNTSSTGLYEEVNMKKSDGTWWDKCAKYCTLYE